MGVQVIPVSLNFTTYTHTHTMSLKFFLTLFFTMSVVFGGREFCTPPGGKCIGVRCCDDKMGNKYVCQLKEDPHRKEGDTRAHCLADPRLEFIESTTTAPSLADGIHKWA